MDKPRRSKSPDDMSDAELESEMDAAYGELEEGPSPSLIWMDSASPLNRIYDRVLFLSSRKVFDTAVVLALAEAVSNVLPKDVYEYPEWKEVDGKLGRLDLNDSYVTPEQWFARLKAIRSIQRKHAIVGMQAGRPQQELISIRERFDGL